MFRLRGLRTPITVFCLTYPLTAGLLQRRVAARRLAKVLRIVFLYSTSTFRGCGRVMQTQRCNASRSLRGKAGILLMLQAWNRNRERNIFFFRSR